MENFESSCFFLIFFFYFVFLDLFDFTLLGESNLLGITLESLNILLLEDEDFNFVIVFGFVCFSFDIDLILAL